MQSPLLSEVITVQDAEEEEEEPSPLEEEEEEEEEEVNPRKGFPVSGSGFGVWDMFWRFRLQGSACSVWSA
jgi:hypothetical protein